MNRKNGPAILMGLLVAILIFIVGIRYGQKVERTNKTIDKLSIFLTPTVTPLPPTPLNIKYETYSHIGCGVSFLLPDYLIKSDESSTSAKFNQDNKEVLGLNCDKTVSLTPPASPEGKLVFVRRNPRSGKNILFTLISPLLPLLENSLKTE